MKSNSIDLKYLVSRGDHISIENGKLIIRPNSGKTVPSDWLERHSREIILEILNIVGKECFIYQSYSTNQIPSRNTGTLTLQFKRLNNCETLFAALNVDLKRQRSTASGRKGSPLPKGQFLAPKNGAFVRLWLDAGLAIPKQTRYGIFHERMGKLEEILFTGEFGKNNRSENINKLNNSSIYPLEISFEEIKLVLNNLPNKERTRNGQASDNKRTRPADKENQINVISYNFQPIPGTCRNYHRTKVNSTKVNSIPNDTDIDPREQTTEQWLESYDG